MSTSNATRSTAHRRPRLLAGAVLAAGFVFTLGDAVEFQVLALVSGLIAAVVGSLAFAVWLLLDLPVRTITGVWALGVGLLIAAIVQLFWPGLPLYFLLVATVVALAMGIVLDAARRRSPAALPDAHPLRWGHLLVILVVLPILSFCAVALLMAWSLGKQTTEVSRLTAERDAQADYQSDNAQHCICWKRAPLRSDERLMFDPVAGLAVRIVHSQFLPPFDPDVYAAAYNATMAAILSEKGLPANSALNLGFDRPALMDLLDTAGVPYSGDSENLTSSGDRLTSPVARARLICADGRTEHISRGAWIGDRVIVVELKRPGVTGIYAFSFARMRCVFWERW